MTPEIGSPRLLIITPNFENNSLGRTYCLWLLATAMEWSVSVAGVKGSSIWGPLADTAFADACILPNTSVLDEHSDPETQARLESLAAASDLIIAVKPLPTSFGVARLLAASTGVPLLLDIDDPDIEVRTIWRPWRERLPRAIASRRYHSLRRLGRAARQVATLVSNPVLQRRYGGAIVPHVRTVPSESPYSSTTEPVVRFVGSARGHKGVPELRAAVGRLADRGFRLEVTDALPHDAKGWESWLGNTTLDEGQLLVSTSDIVAVPSLPTAWSPAQLPAKLIDAMMHGRAIVASRTEPIAWALGDAGILVEPGDVDALTKALDSLSDPALREKLGKRARARAVELFSIDQVLPTFLSATASLLAERSGVMPRVP